MSGGRAPDQDTLDRVWKALSAAWNAHDPMPTLRELQELCSISSTSVARYYLQQLTERGVIRYSPHKARAIWVDVPYQEDV